MSKGGNTGQVLLDKVRSETEEAFQKAQSEMEQMLKDFTNVAKKQIDSLIQEADSTCQEIRKTTDDQIKSQINKAIKEYSKTLTIIEKDTSKTINESWSVIKSNMEKLLDIAKATLGKQTKEIETHLKEMFKYVEKVIADCLKMIQGLIKTAQVQLKDMGQKYIKNVNLN